jgi:hypothetical protein
LERHSPFTDFRQRLTNFQKEAKELLNDTLVNSLLLFLRSKPHDSQLFILQNTTVKDVDNIMFTTGQPGQAAEVIIMMPTPSISSSPDVGPTDLELSVRFHALAKSLFP